MKGLKDKDYLPFWTISNKKKLNLRFYCKKYVKASILAVFIVKGQLIWIIYYFFKKCCYLWKKCPF